MGAMTDPSMDVSGHEERLADGEAESTDGERLQADLMGALGLNHGHHNGSNGVHLPSKIRAKPMMEAHQVRFRDGAAGSIDAGEAHAKRADEHLGTSPARTHIHHSASTGIFRGYSGGIRRGASGGILRGVSGGIHLPRLESITFEMTRLPEEDAGVLRRFTETKEVETPAETRGAGAASNGDSPPGTKSKLRKYLTAVGACSFGFRLTETVLSLITIVVMCSNSHSAGAEFGTLKFDHFQAYRYLVAVNVVVFVYSTVQFIQLMVTVILGMSFIPSILISTWMTFGFDQLFSYLLLSASTSAATVANMSYTGEMGVHLCSRFTLDTFCSTADAAVTISFFTFLAMLSSTFLAIYRIGMLLKEWR
ncbi:hypothetical protein M758_4G246200 [Ceratodon purpureus]|nr:hypothetical protein M758_4G246200 [Ceratodon purpureus]